MTVMEVVCLFKTELLTMKKSGQFPDESGKNKRGTSSQWRWPEVLPTGGIKEIALEGRLL